jgi:prophage regulatory protein
MKKNDPLPRLDRFIRQPEVSSRVGFGNGTLRKLIRDGEFPPPIKLSSQAVGWLESEVNDWMQKKIEASRLT